MSKKPDLEDLLDCLIDPCTVAKRPSLFRKVYENFAMFRHSLFAYSEHYTDHDPRDQIVVEMPYTLQYFNYNQFKEDCEKFRQRQAKPRLK